MSEHRKSLVKAVVEGGARPGKYEAMLDAEDRQELTEFITWWKTQTESSATVSSYKSYLAKAWALEQDENQVTSDQRSALRKYSEFCDIRDEDLDDEPEDDEDDEDLEALTAPEGVFPGDTEG